MDSRPVTTGLNWVSIIYGPRDAAHPGKTVTRILGFKRGFNSRSAALTWGSKLGATDVGSMIDDAFTEFVRQWGDDYSYSPDLEVK